MAQERTTFHGEAKKRSRCYSASPSSISFVARVTFLALTSFIIITIPNSVPIINAEPHSTIPRSNNRYTNYNNNRPGSSPDSSLDTLSSPLNRESYQPPWNPSPKIDPHGFLSDFYPRSPGDWETVANIRGRHGPRNAARYARHLAVPVRIRQVPGDGNCLFHSIAACLHRAENGTHLPMDSHERFRDLRARSLGLRNSAVDALQNAANNGRRRLFLQGEEYLEARELLSAAAAQFDLEGGEYCELMRKESYWGGGPEIVALCNYLQRPIHIYELIPAEEACDTLPPPAESREGAVKTSDQFALRRMACFGSPKFDRREPLHILSADSRFPDVEPRRIRKVGNHFLALFPVTNDDGVAIGGKGGDGGKNAHHLRFRRHALIRGGSRVDGGSREVRSKNGGGDGSAGGRAKGEVRERRTGRWDGGRGSWTHNVMDWFAMGEDGMCLLDQRRDGRTRVLNVLGDFYWGVLKGFL